MHPESMPEWMKNMCDSGTIDFLFFAKCITLKSFFHMIRDTRNQLKINEQSMLNRCSKKGCRNHEQRSKMEAKWEPKSGKYK